MKTTEELAASDLDLPEGEDAPELDRRLFRCKCRHSLDAHKPGDPGWPPQPNQSCTRCDCERYASRPAVWRVTRARRIRVTLAFQSWTIWAPVWVVTSPRGAEVCHVADRVTALNVARNLAAIDGLLANVNRVPQPSNTSGLTLIEGGGQ